MAGARPPARDRRGGSAGPVPLEAPLTATPSMVVTGALGFNVERCESSGRADPRGLAAGEPVAVAIGPLEGVIHAPHRAISSRKLASDKVRADFEPCARGDLLFAVFGLRLPMADGL